MTGAPAAAIVVLVLLKIALDLGLHLAEHRSAPPVATASPAGREALRDRASGVPVERVVRDPRFERLVPAEAELIWLAGGGALGRGPGLRARRGRRGLERRPEQRRSTAGPTADGVRDLYRPSDFANGHTLDHDGRILACEHGPRRVARYEPDGSRTTVVDRYEGKRLNSPNDLVVASDGAIWFTDPPYGILDDSEGYKADSELGGCFVFRFDRASGRVDDRHRRA